MPATPAWLAAVEATFNRGIEGSSQATALARRLDATAVRVEIEGVLAVRAEIRATRLSLVAAGTPDAGRDPVDATVTGTAFALVQLARDPGAATRAEPHSRASVRGDAEIAGLYGKLFALARPDPEEELSRFVGDVAARRTARFAQHAAAWLRGARRTAGENIAEYLQEESRDLVNKTELDEFLYGVDLAREAADRLEARLARLEQRTRGSA